MPDKPSQNEEEYFLKLEKEKIEKRRREAEARRLGEEREERKKLHWMCCPKCGGTLQTETYHEIEVDRCPDCNGIWFDAGEAESLLDREPGAVQGFLGGLFKGLGGGPKST